MRPVLSALITGASSGLGAAMAERMAAPGVTLHLGGREAGRLEAVAERCRLRGAEVFTARIDVTEVEATRRWVQAADDAQPLDLVVANAGIGGESAPPGGDSDLSRLIYQVNVLGAINTVEPVLPAMRARRRGRICLVASLAGTIGVPRGPAYSGSKAALIVQGEAWSTELRRDGVSITVACPGYIRTPMTEWGRGRLPFLMEPHVAAGKILDAALSGRARVSFPWPLILGITLMRLLPLSLRHRFFPGEGTDGPH